MTRAARTWLSSMSRREFYLPAASMALASCGRKPPESIQSIQFGVINVAGTSPFYVAMERGYFRGAGINFVPQMAGRSADVVSLLAAGRIQAGIVNIEPSLLNIVARGSAMRVVLGRDKITPGCGVTGSLYARKAAFPHGSSDVRAWGGKRIWAGQGAGVAEFLFDTLLVRSGVDPKRMPRIRLNRTEAVAALLSESIDGIFVGSNTALDLDSNPGIVREDAGRKVLANVQTSYVAFGSELLKGDLSVGARFLACCLRGVRDFESGVTPQFLKDLAATGGGSDDIIRQCRDYSTPGAEIDRESIKLACDWALNRGYIPSAVSVESIVDERFLALLRKDAA
jgi:NMT1/THI5 like